MKRIVCTLLCFVLLLSLLPAAAQNEEKPLRILFTHDIHSHFLNTVSVENGKTREYGGAARLKTLLDENRTESTVYLDAGDFSMGSLLQAGYPTDAYELRLLGELGCDATTFGNHEFDFGDDGAAKMLNAAMQSGDTLPQLIASNMTLNGDYSGKQKMLADAFKAYGGREYTVLERGGLRIAVFSVFGIDSLDCSPTTGMKFADYIKSSKDTVKTIKDKEKPDLIVCISHAGTALDGKSGEDIELAKAVPDIDVIISGHSHAAFAKPITEGKTVLVACGEYLNNLGALDLTVGKGDVRVTGYRLLPCGENVAEDPVITKKTEDYKRRINETYLADAGVGYDDVLCRCDVDFMSYNEMVATHQEYPFGSLIADSYFYEAKRSGIDDIDVALVALGTIRGTLQKGEITTAQAFDICSLGVGADGSAGHPIIGGYLTGKELKLLVELDASLGPMVGSIKMSYSGLRYTFNTKRMLLDRVTEIRLVREDGSEEKIDDKKMYKIVCNMYAANMIGMLNGLTHGILAITPKFADGSVVEDLYDCSLRDRDGKEIKEWVAFMNYLRSMPVKNGLPTVSERYAAPEGRKDKTSVGGLAVIAHPGAATILVIAIPLAILILIVVLCLTHKRRKARRKRRREKRRAARA